MTSHPRAAAADTAKRSKPYAVAVTGSIACGKSAVGKLLFEMGVPVIDTDDVAHDLLNKPNPHYLKVLDRFGKDIVASEGEPIDRAKLREIVFNDAKAKADLEAILHPAIEQTTKEWIATQTTDVVCVLVPLLFEAKQEAQYDEVWCVLVDYKTQVERLMARNSITAEEADKRIAAQWPQSKKAALSNRIIDNSGKLDETKTQVERCLKGAREAVSKSITVPPVAESKNGEYREILQNFGTLATTAALDKMGDVSSTQHKDAEAELTMRVLTCNDCESHDEHLLRVNVRMHVSNKRGAGGLGCDEHGCSCKCGTTCRVSCACGENCGCGCKPPVPPTPPNPPTPPCPPVPPTDKNGTPKGGDKDALYGFFGLLAFLALIALIAGLVFFQPWKHIPKCDKGCDTTVTIIVKPEPTCPTGCKPTPPPVKPPCNWGCGNYGPPKPPPTPTPPPAPVAQCVTGVYATPPEFILPHLHNQVRNRVSEWSVQCKGDERGAVVIGRQADGRLANIMEFGPHLKFAEQWIVNYSDSRNQVWVNLFQGDTNRFTGRTVYQYAQNGRLMQIRRLDGAQRPLTTSTYERGPDYALCRVVTQRFNQSGVAVDVTVHWYHPDKDVMYGEYFMFELFGQIN